VSTTTDVIKFDAEPHAIASFQKKRGAPKITVCVRSVLAVFAIDLQAEINDSSLRIVPAILLSIAATPPPRCGYHDHEFGQRWAAV